MTSNKEYNIRVFISSTFCDMQAERDYLVNKVFPKIRVAAEKRGVNFVEVDLRWGITQEKEGQSGKVVYSCLKEIENSRPFFIGLLGDRYGWCPTSGDLLDNEEFRRNYAWITDDIHQHLSITEIEMQYGVLRSKHPVNASFYIKKSCQQISQPSLLSKLFGNLTDEQKLARLKKKIRSQRTYPYYEYESIEELGSQVEQALMELLNKLYPNKPQTPLERERLEQHAFMKTRTAVYINVPEALEIISAFAVHQSHRLLCISGQSGMGKSALLANWITKEGPKTGRPIIYHFIANTEDGGWSRQVIMHLIEELCDLYHLTYTPPQRGQQLDGKKILVELLTQESVQKNPPILIIDALDQLRDEDKSLWWLPSSIGEEKWILSAADGDVASDAMASYAQLFPGKSEQYRQEPLPEAQRRQLIAIYLGRHGKELEKSQLERIMKFSLATNTLVLKVLLDELMVFGVYEKLDERINYYISAFSVENFFQRIIHRYEQDYGKLLVQNTLTLLALSRYGLTETTLMHVGNIRPVEWSPFFCAFSSHLVSKNGYISFSHRSILDAVNSIYTVDAINTILLRKQLAKYMMEQAKQRGEYLTCDYEDIPYQLSLGHCWDELYEFLLDVDVLAYFGNKTDDSWAQFWRSLYEVDPKKYTIRKFIDVFRRSCLSNEDIDQKSLDLERMAQNFLTSDDASALAEYAIGLHSKISIWTVVFHQLYIIDHLIATNQTDKALDIANEAMVKYADLPLSQTLIKSSYLMRMATIYKIRENYSKAKSALLEAIQLDSGQGSLPLSSAKFVNLGSVCISEGSYDEAEKYLLQALTLYRKGGLLKRTRGALDCLSFLGKTAVLKNNLEQALNYYQEELKLAEQILVLNDPIIKTINQNIAFIYGKMGKEKEREQTLLKAGDGEGYNVINNYVQLFYSAFETMQQGEYKYAIKLYQDFLKAIEPQKKAFDTYKFKAYANLATCYHNLGDLDTAITFYELAKPEVDKLEGKQLDQMSLFYLNYGIALFKKYRDREVIEVMRRYIDIKSQPDAYDMPDELRTARIHLERSLYACGQECLKQKDYVQAASLYEEAININRTYLHDENLSLRLNQAGLAYGNLNDFSSALNYHVEALEEQKRHGISADDKRLANIYQNIGFDYRFLGDEEKAKEFLEYAEYLNKK